jgi:hypothetical protein
MAGGVSVSRLGRAFRGMDIAVDRLKVGQTPIIEQLRPWGVPVLAPHPKQRDAVVHLGAFPQPAAGFAAASCLQAPQEPGLTTGRIPELPCDHAGAVPDRAYRTETGRRWSGKTGPDTSPKAAKNSPSKGKAVLRSAANKSVC